jgi:hypothetical protein
MPHPTSPKQEKQSIVLDKDLFKRINNAPKIGIKYQFVQNKQLEKFNVQKNVFQKNAWLQKKIMLPNFQNFEKKMNIPESV